MLNLAKFSRVFTRVPFCQCLTMTTSIRDFLTMKSHRHPKEKCGKTEKMKKVNFVKKKEKKIMKKKLFFYPYFFRFQIFEVFCLLIYVRSKKFSEKMFKMLWIFLLAILRDISRFLFKYLF